MRKQVVASIAVGAVAVLALAAWIGRDDVRTAVVTAICGLAAVGVLGWWSLRRGRHTPWPAARSRIVPGHAVVLWKPGCWYCEALLRALGDDRRVTWVNVWHDRAARTQVCALNGGDELTPTVLVGPAVLRNPSADEVRSALGS